ncbi:aminoglycoside phosphotransferase family protein [Streptomyces sp. NPDC096030]|uniref:phosphotransferase family protein n=1 Tax=Streptomyces sp. NPDC096030 TaxID=3155423 RepID=UPI0033317F5F
MEHAELERLGALARDAAHRADASCPCASHTRTVLADRDDGTVVRHGAVVVKAHAPGIDPEEHTARIAVAALDALDGVLLPPHAHPTAYVADRPLTAWPYGAPVDPDDPDAAPWEDAAQLLARLHRTPPPPGLPAMRAPAKAALAVERMRRADDAPRAAVEAVLSAWRTLPEKPTAGRLLCHGDFHLGQLVRDPRTSGRPWVLIDVDDLGIGDPAWDLARPAAWFAAGLLPPDVWSRFLDAYVRAGGPAVAAHDPWGQLDVPARALTVQTAALALAKSTAERRPLDEVEGVMIDTCARIGSLRTELARPASP